MTGKFVTTRRAFCTIALSAIACATTPNSSSEVVCRNSGIRGYDLEAEAALKLLGPKTVNLETCEIYVTEKNGNIYAHSNFRSVDSEVLASRRGGLDRPELTEIPDYATLFSNKRRFDGSTTLALAPRPKQGDLFYEHATKLEGPRSVFDSLHAITLNVVADSAAASTKMDSEIVAAAKKRVKYLLDPVLFAADGTLRIEIGDAENLFIADPARPPPWQIYPTKSARGPPWMAKIRDSLMMKVGSNFRPHELMDRLEQTELRKKNLKVVSLINDLATEKELGASAFFSNVVKLPELSDHAIREVFRTSRRGTVAILGHVRDGNFIISDSQGLNVLLEIPIERLGAWSKEFRCDLVYLGCSAGRQAQGIGAVNPFNPIDAVRRLAAALNEGNYKTFVEKLSGPELALVLDDSAFGYAPHEAPSVRFTGHQRKELVGWPDPLTFHLPVIRGAMILTSRRGESDPWIIGAFVVVVALVTGALIFLNAARDNAGTLYI